MTRFLIFIEVWLNIVNMLMESEINVSYSMSLVPISCFKSTEKTHLSVKIMAEKRTNRRNVKSSATHSGVCACVCVSVNTPTAVLSSAGGRRGGDDCCAAAPERYGKNMSTVQPCVDTAENHRTETQHAC